MNKWVSSKKYKNINYKYKLLSKQEKNNKHINRNLHDSALQFAVLMTGRSKHILFPWIEFRTENLKSWFCFGPSPGIVQYKPRLFNVNICLGSPCFSFLFNFMQIRQSKKAIKYPSSRISLEKTLKRSKESSDIELQTRTPPREQWFSNHLGEETLSLFKKTLYFHFKDPLNTKVLPSVEQNMENILKGQVAHHTRSSYLEGRSGEQK